MIAYDLQCDNGHTFEGWFENAKTYGKQEAQGLIACPICDSTCIARLPSTFGIQSKTMSTNTPGAESALKELNRRIYDYVNRNFDDVGADFTREALKIHYGAAEPRNIRGVSTDQEEKTLREEGVTFFKMPIPAENDPDT